MKDGEHEDGRVWKREVEAISYWRPLVRETRNYLCTFTERVIGGTISIPR